MYIDIMYINRCLVSRFEIAFPYETGFIKYSTAVITGLYGTVIKDLIYYYMCREIRKFSNRLGISVVAYPILWKLRVLK